jgi:outer membrane protein OmpA-like peptidoglycan-associated protein
LPLNWEDLAVTVRRQLNRKTRISISVAVVLLLAGPMLAIKNYVFSAQRGHPVVAPAHSMDDGLLRLKNGATVFLQDSVLSRKISAWLDVDTGSNTAFEIADANFVQGSAEPTPEGRIHISQVAQILNADPKLHAQIGFSDRRPNASLEQLEQSRASRIHGELVAQRVPSSNLTLAIKSATNLSADHVINDLGQQPHLLILFSR